MIISPRARGGSAAGEILKSQFPFLFCSIFFWTTNDFISAARSCEKSYRMYVYSSQCIQERAPMTMITVRAHRLKRCGSRI